MIVKLSVLKSLFSFEVIIFFFSPCLSLFLHFLPTLCPPPLFLSSSLSYLLPLHLLILLFYLCPPLFSFCRCDLAMDRRRLLDPGEAVLGLAAGLWATGRWAVLLQRAGGSRPEPLFQRGAGLRPGALGEGFPEGRVRRGAPSGSKSLLMKCSRCISLSLCVTHPQCLWANVTVTRITCSLVL